MVLSFVLCGNNSGAGRQVVHDTTDSLTTFAIMRCCCALKKKLMRNEAYAERHKRSGWLLKGLTVRQGRRLRVLFCNYSATPNIAPSCLRAHMWAWNVSFNP